MRPFLAHVMCLFFLLLQVLISMSSDEESICLYAKNETPFFMCFAHQLLCDETIMGSKLYRYRMDYLKFVEHHRATNADITIGCLPVDYERASDFGLMKIDEEGRIYVSACMLGRAGLPKETSCLKDLAHLRTRVVCCVQDFAEKPKGDALEAMKVDTTVLGEQAESLSPSFFCG